MTVETLHANQTANHVIETWTYTTAAARLAATGFTANDIGKIAYQQDTSVYYRLTSNAPTWNTFSDTTASGPAAGDITGTYPNPTVIQLRGTKIDATAPVNNDYIRYNAASGTYLPTQQYSEIILVIADVLSVQTGKQRIYNRFGVIRTIRDVEVSVGTAPLNGNIIVDLNINGTTIFTNQAHRPTIISGTYTGVSSGIDVSAWGITGCYFTVDIDQIGGVTPGSNLTAQILLV